MLFEEKTHEMNIMSPCNMLLKEQSHEMKNKMSRLTTDARHHARAGREVAVLCGGPAVAQGRGRGRRVHRAVLREGGGGLGPRVGAGVVAAAPPL
jgi:hypothetical protein